VPSEVSDELVALVLAAGRGTRMRSTLPKPLVPLAGRPLVAHLLEALERGGLRRCIVVVGHGADAVRGALEGRCSTVFQERQLGMAHAVEVARPALGNAGRILVTVGDSPLLEPATIRALVARHAATNAACTFLTAIFPRPLPYARVLRAPDGSVRACVEERDATPEERESRELSSSHYLFQANALWRQLGAIRPHPVTGERYLTDVVGLLLGAGEKVEALRIQDWTELCGLNTPEELAWAEGILAGRSRADV
jgi:bifunctional N-acetylglucosamine-1-phosphate-uridyltransferase/glucosamine-1-phosphate-acetyltransferase GlmU-like protein